MQYSKTIATHTRIMASCVFTDVIKGWRIQQRLMHILFISTSRVGISGTTAKSRQRKCVPSSHMGPVALVASPGKSKT